MDISEFFKLNGEWSENTFGPGERTEGVLKHIEKEIDEVRKEPHSIEEWADIVILAMDGARRSAHADGVLFENALLAKLGKNKNRKWPDWRTADKDKPIEHIREE